MSKIQKLLDRAQKLPDQQKTVIAIVLSILVVIIVVILLSLINSLIIS